MFSIIGNTDFLEQHYNSVKLSNDLTWNPANSRGTTFLQNISRAFGRVCSAMLRSPDERTLNPGTLETIEDSLDDLESHLSICSG